MFVDLLALGWIFEPMEGPSGLHKGSKGLEPISLGPWKAKGAISPDSAYEGRKT